jgi:hypothetical protein
MLRLSKHERWPERAIVPKFALRRAEGLYIIKPFRTKRKILYER